MASGESTQISAALNQIYGENVNKKFELKGSKVLIGRAFNSDIRLECPSVSRKHCILTYTDKGWLVEDNHSQNGTWISGQRLQPNQSRLLDCGDIIFLGPPSEMPQAFCFEINYEFENLTEFSVKEEKDKVKDVSQTLDDSLEDLVCDKHFSPKKTPGEETSFTVSDDEVIVFSPQKELPIKEAAVNSVDLLSKPIPHAADSICKRKLPITSPASISSYSEPKKCKKVQASLDNVRDPETTKLNKANLGDQIHEISSTETDQMGDSQSLLDVKKEDIPDQSCQSNEKSETELLKSELSKMAEKIKKLKYQNTFLVGKYSARKKENDVIKKQLTEHQKLKEDLQSCEQKAKNEIKKEILEKFEEDLICNICTELLIKPTVLECSHTFCEYCIHEWKKKKNECPMCRGKIQNMTRVLTLENFIDKALETLTPEQRVKREELIKERLMAEQQKKVQKSPGYPRYGRRRGSRRRGVPNRDAPIPIEISPRRNLLLPIQLPPISYPLFINNPNFRVPEVIISDNEMDTINIFVS